MNKAITPDLELIQQIKRGGLTREQALAKFFKRSELRLTVKRFVLQNKGNEHDSEDLFAEGIIVLDRNIRQDKFRGESSVGVYFVSICKFLWMNRLRKMKRVDYTDQDYQLDNIEFENPESMFMSEEKKELIHKALAELGSKCETVLKMWMLNYSMKEIAEKMDFSNEAIARKNKYRCFNRLKDIIQSNNTLKN